MTKKDALNVPELKQAMASELARRRCPGEQVAYLEERDSGKPGLYGLTGAVNIMAALDLPLGSRSVRTHLAQRLLAWQREDGSFDGGLGPGHALCMVIAALNLLGEPVPANIAPLAPTDPAKLPGWLERHNWQSTHKELCGQTIPLLASGLVGSEWTTLFVDAISTKLSPLEPLKTWCAADAPRWQVISSIYHILSSFDTARIPYPQPELLFKRLLDLHWENVPDSETRTYCTDADWAWLLLRLGEQLPRYSESIVSNLRRVSSRRVRAWKENPDAILAGSTHHLYCYLWSSAVFQPCVRDHYTGGYIRDTFNDPSLFRL